MTDVVDSHSIGDPQHFLTLAQLRRAHKALPEAQKHVGRVHLIVSRGVNGVRTCPERVHLTPTSGIPGDAWRRKKTRKRVEQLAVMQRDVAELVANGQPLTLFGDNLFVELNLSAANLPVGTTLKLGTATLTVTPEPHTGCKKFAARFGKDALRFVAHKQTHDLMLRGIYLQVTRSGDVAVGDVIRVLRRPPQV